MARNLMSLLILVVLGVVSAAATAVNRPPEIDPIPDQVVPKGRPLVFGVAASDPDGDALIYLLQDAPAGMTIDPNGVVTWNPAPGSTGMYGVTVQVTDVRGSQSKSDQEVVGVIVPEE